MPLFEVEIEETMTKLVTVSAEDMGEARAKVRKLYADAEIILTADNANIDVNFNGLQKLADK